MGPPMRKPEPVSSHCWGTAGPLPGALVTELPLTACRHTCARSVSSPAMQDEGSVLTKQLVWHMPSDRLESAPPRTKRVAAARCPLEMRLAERCCLHCLNSCSNRSCAPYIHEHEHMPYLCHGAEHGHDFFFESLPAGALWRNLTGQLRHRSVHLSVCHYTSTQMSFQSLR